jgi:NADPH:quinone reductase-like Zn-dependent oxidoreductase
MKAVLLHAYGGVDQLDYATAPRPEPQHGEVLVRIHATSVNPVDWKIRSGAARERFPQDFPAILGRDLSGEVAGLGPGVTGFTQGQRVMALALHTYAEYTVAKAETLATIPDKLDYQQAASLPLIITTGAQLAERAGKVDRGQTVLVTGALGSVGRTAVFVAQQHGARVIAGVRASQREEAAELKVAQVVALDDETEVKNLSGLDTILDTVGGKVGAALLHALKPSGTYASVVGPPEGADTLDIKVVPMMAQPDAKRLSELAQAVADGEFAVPIAKVMPLSEIRQAQQLGEKGGSGGKIVLTV